MLSNARLPSRVADRTRSPACTIVIVSWNTADLLKQCLSSLRAADSPGDSGRTAYDVVVIDNASADGTAEMVRQEFPWARLIANVENVGFARANNQAIRMTDSDYVLLLNPDTIVETGAIQALLRFMDSKSSAGAAGADLRNPDGSRQEGCFPEPSLRRELWRLLHLDAIYPYAKYSTDGWRPPYAYPVDVVQGTCVLFRRAALSEIGLLDEDYFIYSEEVDLCTRLRRAGWSVYWVPAARIVHLGGQSTRQCAEEMFLRLYEGKIKYFRKHRGRATGLIYKLILVAASIFRLGLAPAALAFRQKRQADDCRLASNYWRLVRRIATL